MQIRRRSPSYPIDVSIVRYQAVVEDLQPNNILEEIV